jgi:MraZ protein
VGVTAFAVRLVGFSGVGVSDYVFQGGANLLLDGKGRMTMPVCHRDVLKAIAEDKLTVTKSPKRCLLVFPRPAWETFRAKLLQLPISADDWRRIFLGSAKDVDIDGASRLLLPPELREWAGIERDVLLIGMGSRFEVWDRVRHDAHEASVVTAGLPAALQDQVL